MGIHELVEFSDVSIIKERKIGRLLILADGFEKRCSAFSELLASNNCAHCFQDCILLIYKHHNRSRIDEVRPILGFLTENKPSELVYDRFNPSHSEFQLRGILDDHLAHKNYQEIIIDISVMSKLLIIILVYLTSKYNIPLKIIYSEPKKYSPSEEDFIKRGEEGQSSNLYPSFGVNQVVRTPYLSNSVMQGYPILLVAFTSFNEQLIRALLSDISPHRLILGLSAPPIHSWRLNACEKIHEDISDLYHLDNNDSNWNKEKRIVCTLNPLSVFDFLSRIYNENCFFNRIIIAPTGSKMQALGCAMFKLCCPDIHIEYPTPESYFTSGFSSDEIRKIHLIEINNLPEYICSLQECYKLNG